MVGAIGRPCNEPDPLPSGFRSVLTFDVVTIILVTDRRDADRQEGDLTQRLRNEIRQKRPFDSLEQASYLNVQRTANLLVQGMADVLKPAGLTPTQYNVLRILRGAKAPLTCGQVGERMITRDPDVTRILDRMERQGLVRRTRTAEDRRVVVTEITAKGRDALARLDEPVARLHAAQLGHMGEKKLRTLSSLLEEARAKIG